jgi:hypothetical protein
MTFESVEIVGGPAGEVYLFDRQGGGGVHAGTDESLPMQDTSGERFAPGGADRCRACTCARCSPGCQVRPDRLDRAHRTGETGTGKELYRPGDSRPLAGSARPLRQRQRGAIPTALIASELSGIMSAARSPERCSAASDA